MAFVAVAIGAAVAGRGVFGAGANFANSALGGFLGGLAGSGGNLKTGFVGALTAGAFYGVGHKIDFAKHFGDAADAIKTVAHGVVGGASQVLRKRRKGGKSCF